MKRHATDEPEGERPRRRLTNEAAGAAEVAGLVHQAMRAPSAAERRGDGPPAPTSTPMLQPAKAHAWSPEPGLGRPVNGLAVQASLADGRANPEHYYGRPEMDTLVYKVLSGPDYAEAVRLGYTKTLLDETDGFVHLSTAKQLRETLRRYYTGHTGLHLLEYVVEHFSAEVRFEDAPSRPADSPFPHLFGSLRLDAATRHWVLDGQNTLPGGIGA